MSTAELKISIGQLLQGVSDDSVLKAIHALLSKVTTESTDWGNELPTHVLDELLLSIQEADKGERGTTHEEMLAEARRDFPNLKL